MRVFTLLLAFLLISAASAQSAWYPGSAKISVLTIPAAETSDNDQCWSGIPANNTTHILLTSASISAQPDVPRNIIATPSGAVTGTLKLAGIDIAGSIITENLTWSNSASVGASTKAFKTITQVDGTFTQETARTLKVGTGDLLGLNTLLSFNSVLFTLVNGVKESTAPSITTNSTVLSLNTVDPNSALNGGTVKVWYIV